MHNHSGEGDLGKTLTTRLCFHANKRISNDCLAASFLRAKGWGLDGGGTKPAELVRVCVCVRGVGTSSLLTVVRLCLGGGGALHPPSTVVGTSR